MEDWLRRYLTNEEEDIERDVSKPKKAKKQKQGGQEEQAVASAASKGLDKRNKQ